MGIPAMSALAQAASDNLLPVYQQNEEERQARAAAEADASALELQAGRREEEAAEAEKIGLLRQAEQVRAARAERSTMRTGYAYSGVKVDAGSAGDVVADHAAWSESERQKIEYETSLESWGLKYDAAVLRSDAAAVRASGGASSTAAIGRGVALLSER